MWLTAGLKAVGEVFGFARTLTDSKQRRERFELRLDQKAKKALNAGEKTFDLWTKFYIDILPQVSKNKTAMYMLKRYHRRIGLQKKIFDAND